MPHIIDGTCCKKRECNKCDGYRKQAESLQAELDQWKREAISDKAKLGEYKILEEQGLLHKATIKDGTPIFCPIIEDGIVYESCIHETSYLYGHIEYAFGELGKDWFLTREEAEIRLVELEGGVSNE